MNFEKIHNVLLMTATGFLVVVALCGVALVSAVRNNVGGNIRSFTVSGEGKANFAPDIATFNFGLITQGGNNIEELQSQSDKKVNDIISFIKESGVEDKDIKTQNYNVNPRYSYPTNEAPRITGYEINQQVSVKVRDIKKAGEIVSGVVKRGANNVSELRFTIENMEDVKNQAKEEAIQNARKNAKEMAKAGGFRIGRLVSIDEGFSGMPVPVFDQVAEGRGGGGSTPDIRPGEGEFTANVMLRFEIR